MESTRGCEIASAGSDPAQRYSCGLTEPSTEQPCPGAGRLHRGATITQGRPRQKPARAQEVNVGHACSLAAQVSKLIKHGVHYDKIQNKSDVGSIRS